MNPLSRKAWKKVAKQANRNPGEAGQGWLLGGLLLVVAVIIVILKGCI